MRRRAFLQIGLSATTLGILPGIALAAKKPLGERIALAAETQAGVTLLYDPSYARLSYPNGDVPLERGVCADVVIRALRQCGSDLQVEIHEDMRAHFSAYPKAWGLKSTDASIDHRRVLNMEAFFKRRGAQLAGGDTDLRAGDFVSWRLPGGLPHIGVISTQQNADNTRPLIVHNIGAGVQIEDVLIAWPRQGRFRYPARL